MCACVCVCASPFGTARFLYFVLHTTRRAFFSYMHVRGHEEGEECVCVCGQEYRLHWAWTSFILDSYIHKIISAPSRKAFMEL